MSNYNIGQLRYSKKTEYLDFKINKKYESTDHEYDENLQMGTKDLKITHAFKGLQTYYFKCSFKDFGENIPQTFTIKLKTEDGKREQIIKTYELGSGNYYHSVEFAFTPKTDFSKIVFELARSQQYDFMEGEPRKMAFYNGSRVVLASVFNILESLLELNSIFKLGIQGPTDLIVCVNGEPIRIGKSGIFEIFKDDFNIYSVGFIINPNDTNKDKNFIMDYCY